ncbi:hypothetical protein ACFLY6_02795 [Candidatus Dependentiae bacterium]
MNNSRYFVVRFLLLILFFSNSAHSFRCNGYWLCSEKERVVVSAVGAVAASIIAGCAVPGGLQDRGIACVGAAMALGGILYWSMGESSPKSQCREASEFISKIIDDGIILPMLGKKSLDIVVVDEIEKHFVNFDYPLLKAREYLRKNLNKLNYILGLTSAVAKFLRIRMELDEVEFEDFKTLLNRVSWGFTGEIDGYFLAATKLVCERFLETCREALTALTQDERFEVQRRSYDEAMREKERLRVAREAIRIEREKIEQKERHHQEKMRQRELEIEKKIQTMLEEKKAEQEADEAGVDEVEVEPGEVELEEVETEPGDKGEDQPGEQDDELEPGSDEDIKDIA